MQESDQCCGSRKGNRYEKNDSITAVAAVGGDGMWGKHG